MPPRGKIAPVTGPAGRDKQQPPGQGATEAERALTRNRAPGSPMGDGRSVQAVSVRASWKRARKVAIWALVTVSEGENVPAAVPLVIPWAAMQAMPAA